MEKKFYVDGKCGKMSDDGPISVGEFRPSVAVRHDNGILTESDREGAPSPVAPISLLPFVTKRVDDTR